MDITSTQRSTIIDPRSRGFAIVRVTHDSELDLYGLIKGRMPAAPSTERVPV